MIEKAIAQRAKSKTYWLGLAVSLLAYLQANFPLLEGYLGDYKNAVLFLVGLGICYLRELTDKPLSKK